MGRYLLVEVSRISGKNSQGLYAYDEEVPAVAAFHQKLAGAMKNETYEVETVMVVDEYGAMVKCERYEKHEPEQPEVKEDEPLAYSETIRGEV